uniref:Uncharacterized protein n=1 Tax=Arundo donax TaxID=35708 RepID=A0A0A9DMW5_ARUDO
MSNDCVRCVLLSTAASYRLLFLDLVWFPATTEHTSASLGQALFATHNIDAEDKRCTSQHQ